MTDQTPSSTFRPVKTRSWFFKRFNWVMRNSPFKGAKHAVLLVLSFRGDETGYCWTSFSSLARDSGLGRSTAVRAVDELKEAGWIEQVEGPSLSNSYQLLLPGCPFLKAPNYTQSGHGTSL